MLTVPSVIWNAGSVQLLALSARETFGATHVPHSRSLLASGVLETYWVGALQVVQLVQLGAFSTALKLPSAQASHLRSALLLPGVAA
jgi:hypothetical protein